MNESDLLLPSRGSNSRCGRRKLGLCSFCYLLAILVFCVCIFYFLGDKIYYTKDCHVDCGWRVNIHIKLSEEAESQAICMNEYCREHDKNTALDLLQVEQPHITLYLTRFQSLSVLGGNQSVLAQRIPNALEEGFSKCIISLGKNVQNGTTYALWDVNMRIPHSMDCLQQLSDAVVNNTHDLIIPNQPVPSWIKDLSPEEARLKEEMVKKYGSPNVFSQFQPQYDLFFQFIIFSSHFTFLHSVTIAVDPIDPSVLANVVNNSSFPLKEMSFPIRTVGMGTVGPYGTVLRYEDIADFHV